MILPVATKMMAKKKREEVIMMNIHCDVFTLDVNTVSLLLDEKRKVEMFESKSSSGYLLACQLCLTGHENRIEEVEEKLTRTINTQSWAAARHRHRTQTIQTGYSGLGRECAMCRPYS